MAISHLFALVGSLKLKGYCWSLLELGCKRSWGSGDLGSRLTADAVGSMLSLGGLHANVPQTYTLRAMGVAGVFRSQRILVGKTPNLTPAEAVL